MLATQRPRQVSVTIVTHFTLVFTATVGSVLQIHILSEVVTLLLYEPLSRF